MSVISKLQIPSETTPIDIRNGYYIDINLYDISDYEIESSVLPYQPYIGMKLSVIIENNSDVPIGSNSEHSFAITFGDNNTYSIKGLNYILLSTIMINGIVTYIENDYIELSYEDVVRNANKDYTSLTGEMDDDDITLNLEYISKPSYDTLASKSGTRVIVNGYIAEGGH